MSQCGDIVAGGTLNREVESFGLLLVLLKLPLSAVAACCYCLVLPRLHMLLLASTAMTACCYHSWVLL